MRTQVIAVPLAGTETASAPRGIDVTVPALSIVAIAGSDVTVNLRSSRQSDYVPLRSGRAWTVEQPGHLIEPSVWEAWAAGAVTLYLVVTYP